TPQNICDFDHDRWSRLSRDRSPGYDFEPEPITLLPLLPTCAASPEDRYNWTLENIASLRQVYDIYNESDVVIYTCTKLTHLKNYPIPQMIADYETPENRPALSGHC